MFMKRIALLLVMILLLAAGCAGKTAPGPSQGGLPSPAETPVPAPTPVETPVPETPGAAAEDGLGSLFAAAVLQDLDGNEVSLGELISGNKLTLLNIWGTFCGPCIQEMPDLGEIARSYADQGFGIVGLTCDILDEDGQVQSQVVQDARDILESTRAEYPVLILNFELMEAAELMYVPTSYLVDAAGSIVDGPLVGSMSGEEWRALIDGYLSAQG